MKSFITYLTELDLHQKGDFKAIFKAADEAEEKLEKTNFKAETLISKWIGGTKESMRSAGFGVFSTAPLERAAQSNTPDFQDLVKAFEPVKILIQRQFGNSIKLFRSERTAKLNPADKNGRTLLSYTSDPHFAEVHAAGYRIKTLEIPTEADGKKAIADFLRDGEVTINWPGVGKKKIVIDPEGDDKTWANVMDGEEVEFGDLIQDIIGPYIKDAQEWQARTKKSLDDIVVEEVSIDDIIWASNRAYQSEFIVKNVPRPRKKYLDK